ncbi:MAG: DsbA family protein [Actinomycetota bacterium]|nr:DsbA family protein [Actinomycetota bacterium]
MRLAIRFHFDPACPWAWQTSKWIREASRVRDLDIEWRFFSLKMVNSDRPQEASISPALRTLALVTREFDNEHTGRLYEALGTRMHDRDEGRSVAVVKAATKDVGLEEALVDRALEDEDSAEAVRADFHLAVDEVGCFGVPTIVMPSGKGLFGPVLSLAPTGEEAGELWDHFSWFVEQDGFFEIKRERDREPGS